MPIFHPPHIVDSIFITPPSTFATNVGKGRVVAGAATVVSTAVGTGGRTVVDVELELGELVPLVLVEGAYAGVRLVVP
ncbi:MAG TPA: hypothetical protein VEJ84_10620 [Acidimicrobiales bacterium]|nr:hypothetical protein [Acidimicrobiales bacterium]